MSDTKTEALLQNIDWQVQTNLMNQVSGSYSPALNDTLVAARVTLKSKSSEIEQLKAELQRVYAVVTSHAKITLNAEAERDQLKAKNEKLVDAVETVCEGFTLHPSARKILEAGLYGEALKENT